MSKNIVIFGSSRSDGDTMEAVSRVFGESEYSIIDLMEKDISYYDYSASNQNDDFAKVIEEMTKAENIIFATPVYWYSMSAVLKTFFDRFTDLITINKPLGKRLKGKNIYMIACGADEEIPAYFQKPVSSTCNYLGMAYKGCFYYSASIAHGNDEAKLAQIKRKADEFGAVFI